MYLSTVIKVRNFNRRETLYIRKFDEFAFGRHTANRNCAFIVLITKMSHEQTFARKYFSQKEEEIVTCFFKSLKKKYAPRHFKRLIRQSNIHGGNLVGKQENLKR